MQIVTEIENILTISLDQTIKSKLRNKREDGRRAKRLQQRDLNDFILHTETIFLGLMVMGRI